jgi:hypothetical protein
MQPISTAKLSTCKCFAIEPESLRSSSISRIRIICFIKVTEKDEKKMKTYGNETFSISTTL